MEPNSENRLMVSVPAGETAPGTALTTALSPENGAPQATGDTRLDGMMMPLDVMVKVRSFCVRDLLALDKGTVVETDHEHTQDVPVRCGGSVLTWAEFEVVNNQLAVRLTRLG